MNLIKDTKVTEAPKPMEHRTVDSPKNETWKTAFANGLELLRPYLMGIVLLFVVIGLLYIGDAFLFRFGFPWALATLLVVGAVAHVWGVKPAICALIVSLLLSDIILPDLHITHYYGNDLPLRMRIVRMMMFVACGVATIWLTYRAQRMREQSERRRGVIGTLQRMILPEHLPAVAGYDLAGVYQPAIHDDEVGGDFYDFYPIEGNFYGMLIGDVMGKGKEAAAYTAQLRYSVRALTSSELSPGNVLSRLNALLERQEMQFSTATMMVGILNAETGVLTYASAGHEAAMLRRAQGMEETLDSTGPVLGVGIGFTYEERSVKLESGDALLLMTDGATEARNNLGQFLDGRGVWRMFRDALGKPSASQALSSLHDALQTFIGRNRRDDIALLLLKRR